VHKRPAVARTSGLSGSLQHGLAILDLFGSGGTALGLVEMASALGIHRSTASRIAAELASAGYLAPAERPGRYRLGPRLAELGQYAAGQPSFAATALPYLTALAVGTGETAHLGVLDGTASLTLVVVDGWHTIRMHTWVGRRTPAHCSSMGKALLADLSEETIRDLFPATLAPAPTKNTIRDRDRLHIELQEIRGRGVAFDLEELEVGLRCIAAPLFDAQGKVVASMGVSAPAGRLGQDAIDRVAGHVAWGAAQATAALGGTRGTPTWCAAPESAPKALAWVEGRRAQAGALDGDPAG
jgi:DNA-binding IclR family transcriptional regulator